MSGTLIVQNLQGPASGANANKIIVPAGQVLDASAGTFTPSVDQIVQVKVGKTFSATTTTSTSYVATNLGVNITPKYANSLMLISVKSSSFWSSSTANGEYIYATIFRDAVNIGISNSPNTLALMGAYGTSQNYAKTFVFGADDLPNTTSLIQYIMHIKKYGGTGASVNDDRLENTMTVWEIKQ